MLGVGVGGGPRNEVSYILKAGQVRRGAGKLEWQTAGEESLAFWFQKVRPRWIWLFKPEDRYRQPLIKTNTKNKGTMVEGG